MVQRLNIFLLVRKPRAACLQSLPTLSLKADGNAYFDILPLLWSTPTFLLFLNVKTYNFARKDSCENIQPAE